MVQVNIVKTQHLTMAMECGTKVSRRKKFWHTEDCFVCGPVGSSISSQKVRRIIVASNCGTRAQSRIMGYKY